MMETMFADLPDVLTPEETAKALRMGRSTTYEQLRTGQLPSVRIGKRFLVPKAALIRLLMGAEEG